MDYKKSVITQPLTKIKDIETLVGKDVEYTFYKEVNSTTMRIAVKKLASYIDMNLLERDLKENKLSVMTAEAKIWMQYGTSLGEQFEKNYWKNSVYATGRMDTVRYERPVNYQIAKNKNIVWISGKMDIIDHTNKEIIELKTSQGKTYGNFARDLRQAYLYKIMLEKEDVKYKDYKVVVLVYYKNYAELGMKSGFVRYVVDLEYEDEEQRNRCIKFDKEIREHYKKVFETVLNFWDTKQQAIKEIVKKYE